MSLNKEIHFRKYVNENMDDELEWSELVIVKIDKNILTLEDGTIINVPESIIKNKSRWITEDIIHHGKSIRFAEYSKHIGKLILT